MSIYLQNFMPIQPRTSLLKFGHLAVKSGKGTVLYLSTKVCTAAATFSEGLEVDELLEANLFHSGLHSRILQNLIFEMRIRTIPEKSMIFFEMRIRAIPEKSMKNTNIEK